MNQLTRGNLLDRRRQKGAITMFSAVLILILLTEMIVYAVQVGVFEQRKSSNEMRQKIAFHTADSALQQAKEFLRANSIFIASPEAELLPVVDGGGDIVGYQPGWLANGATRWTPCAGAYEGNPAHPCWAEPVAAFRDNSYFYTLNDSNELMTNALVGDGTNTRVTLHALLCMLDIDRSQDPVVQGCTMTPAANPRFPQLGEQDSRYFLVTLMARGEAECAGANCAAEALVSEKLGSYSPGGGAGGPGAPLTTKSTLPESGDTDIVPNPNGGGVGVPMSVWIDANADIEGFGGSWATCEAHEWYNVDMMPEDYRCPAMGNCTCDGKKQLSYALPGAGEQFINFDMVPDPSFPPDLFEYVFNEPGTPEGVDNVKQDAEEVYPDCSALGPQSHGVIVIDGDCSLGGNTLVGSKNAPVMLVLTGADNSMGGTIEIFGTVMVTEAINANAELSGNGNVTIYGALIADGDITQFGGNLKLVYVDTLVNRALETGGFGAVAGGWTDFHPDWR